MTYIELLTNAYRLRNVIDENESPSAEQGVAGLAVLNQLMAELEADNIVLQYAPAQASGLSEQLTIPAYAEAGITAKLAERLVAGAPLSPELEAQLTSGMETILRQATKDQLTANNMAHVPSGEGRRRTAELWR